MTHLPEQPKISISCIETRHHENAAKALLQTLKVCQNLPITKVYWFSDVPCPISDEIQWRWNSVQCDWIKIDSFNQKESFNRQFEKLTLDLLPKTVETEFNLLIQADGYAVNAEAWTDDFYRYDYIGATWPNEIEGRNVGNGGFSWRSKKLNQAIIQLRSQYSLDDLLGNSEIDDSWIDKFGGRSIPEDNLICKVYRPILEQEFGIRFAPAELADRFSIETNSLSPWFGRSFGFHGRLAGSFYLSSS